MDKKAPHIELGIDGEALAVNYLVANGYKILEQNYRYKKSEIDIIVMKDEVLIFVEVKTRRSHAWGYPESCVSNKKVHMIAQAAFHYMEVIGHEWEIRFDIIAILAPKGRPHHLDHFEDAFVP